MRDLTNTSTRMAPGAPGTSPAAVAFTTGAQAAIRLRPDPGAGAALSSVMPFAIKITGAGAGAHVATGQSDVSAPTVTDPLFETSDGWQDMVLAAGDTHVRLFGAVAGTVYFWKRGV